MNTCTTSAIQLADVMGENYLRFDSTKIDQSDSRHGMRLVPECRVAYETEASACKNGLKTSSELPHH